VCVYDQDKATCTRGLKYGDVLDYAARLNKPLAASQNYNLNGNDPAESCAHVPLFDPFAGRVIGLTAEELLLISLGASLIRVMHVDDLL
jgi:hypothetical protein